MTPVSRSIATQMLEIDGGCKEINRMVAFRECLGIRMSSPCVTQASAKNLAALRDSHGPQSGTCKVKDEQGSRF